MQTWTVTGLAPKRGVVYAFRVTLGNVLKLCSALTRAAPSAPAAYSDTRSSALRSGLHTPSLSRPSLSLLSAHPGSLLVVLRLGAPQGRAFAGLSDVDIPCFR